MFMNCFGASVPTGTETPLRQLRLFAILALCVTNADSIAADEPQVKEIPAAVEAATTTDAVPVADKSGPSAGRQIAVVLCGHPGDQEHLELFRASVEKIRTGLSAHYQFQPENIHVFMGEDPGGEDTGESVPAVEVPEKTGSLPATKPATKEVIAAELLTLKSQITINDRLFVIVIGHTYFENNLAWYNLHGPDVQQKEFAELFQGIPAKEQVFFVTIPCGGYYIRTLTGPGRYVISATESDLEINETLCPHILADMFSAAPMTDWDLDSDKRISLFEFYIALCRGVADRYIDETLIATEHALLDDNADGKGSELQQHYLTEDQGGLPTNRQRQKLTEGRDGMASSSMYITSF